MSNNSKRVRYTVSDVKNERFYKLPKFLFEIEIKVEIEINGEIEIKVEKLNNDARVLYSLLRDRHGLSIRNKWINDKNEVYLCYAREEMADMLGISQPTVRKAVSLLKKFGLMEEEVMGLNRRNRIYLTLIEHETLDAQGVKKSFTPECKNLSVKNEKIFYQSDTDENNTDQNDTDNIVVVVGNPGNSITKNKNSPSKKTARQNLDQSDTDTEIASDEKTDHQKNIQDLRERILNITGTTISIPVAARYLRQYSLDLINQVVNEMERQIHSGIEILRLGSWMSMALRDGYQPDQKPSKKYLSTKKTSKSLSRNDDEDNNKRKALIKKLYLSSRS